MTFSETLTAISDAICGYPLFFTLIGGGLLLLISSRMVSIRRLPHAIKALREDKRTKNGEEAISSAQALASVVAATVGMGNIAGVAIAIAMGGPGAIFWMWISALVGMCTKYHEGVLAVKYRTTKKDGGYAGGPMHIITQGLGQSWKWLAVTFAIAGMFGTLCIMNANQLTEALINSATKAGITLPDIWMKFAVGCVIAILVSIVVLGGIKRIARVATIIVPFMVGAYFLMVLYIIITNLAELPGAITAIFTNAFNLKAGWGALAGIAIIGARRAALVNDAGVGTASLMHSTSANKEPVREGLVAMLGPAIDSGFVCTLTALAILLGGAIPRQSGQGLTIALNAFSSSIPAGDYLLTAIVTFFALSSMFTYSFYGTSCATYLLGEKKARLYTYAFILSLVVFAVVPLGVAVALCDMFYALMAFPTMFTLIMLRKEVRAETKRYFS
ncbi:MAG: alanine:cation symporter family protein [Paramuribaculum sp.]|nr:alanine:cation symporter family protein [Paramuribaculum sp.]